MEYPRITALVPEGEHFDAAVATVNEGIYLTTGHFSNIEQALHSSAQALAAAETAQQAAESQVTELQAQLEAAQDNASASADALAIANARIAELEGAAAGFSETKKTVEEKPAGESVAGIDPITAEAMELRKIRDGKKK